jgi:hypothetical protein
VDHIVVQSYDGQLTFFEQEVQSFSRLLSDFLLPGPMAYLTASDSFVTTTAGLELVAYRYNSIAAANWESKQQQGERGLDATVCFVCGSRCSTHKHAGLPTHAVCGLRHSTAQHNTAQHMAVF